MSKHTKNDSPKPKKLDVKCYFSQKYFLNGLRVQILGGPCGLSKKSKIQQKYFKKLFHMGEEASPKGKESAADLPM